MMQAPIAVHDAGGQLRWQFDRHVKGTAALSDCRRYRWSLSRDWTPLGQAPSAILWVGMNPSTADDQFDDPTCRREISFSKNWGFTRYLKGNVLGYRSTDPKKLPDDPLEAEGIDNREHLLDMARQAEMIILCYGRLPTRYYGVISETVQQLRNVSAEIFCLGKNQDGSPKHPLYLSSRTVRQSF